MGFGHRVYQTRDPRAEALSKVYRQLAAENATAQRAAQVEHAALTVLGKLKPHRSLATNVEFYAAVVLRALGIPPEWCPATFACARLAGYTAHYYEQREYGKLIRPLSIYRSRSTIDLTNS